MLLQHRAHSSLRAASKPTPARTLHGLPATACRNGIRLRPARRAPQRVHASLGDSFKELVEQASIVAAVGAVTLTAASLVDVKSERFFRKLEPPPPQQLQDPDGENIKWAVICVLSCVPLFNWTGWVFAAIDSEVPALYYTYAALYGLPLLFEGFDIGSFTIAMVVLGAVHAQAQRVLVTEPDTRFQLPAPVSLLSPLLGAMQATFRRIPRALATVKQLEEGDNNRMEIELDREENAEQLRSFDEQLQQRAKTKARSRRRWWEE